MDEPLQLLERQLHELKPNPPSRALVARVEAAMAESVRSNPPIAAVRDVPSQPRSPVGWSLAALAAVAALAVIVLRQETGHNVSTGGLTQASPSSGLRAAGSAVEDRYRPVAAGSVLYDLKDEGSVMLNDETPGRRVRYRYVDTYTWKNPATNASLKWSVPREEIRVLPVVLQ